MRRSGGGWSCVLAAVVCWCSGTIASGELANPTSYLKAMPGAPAAKAADVWKNFKVSPNHEEIVAAAPDVWQLLPKELDPKYKNPCWTDENGRFRCVPYFYILGVSKCGTTDIYSRIQKHPDYAKGQKGPHWWDECEYPPRPPCNIPSGTFNGYLNSFGTGARQIQQKPSLVTGEASSNTFTAVLTYVRGIATARGVNITLAQLMHEASPYMRAIVIFRDPVARFHSAFHYYRPRPQDPFEPPEALHERAVYQIKKWHECLAGKSQYECVKGYTPQELIKGMYSEFVEPWTKVLDKNQILFVRNEDYQRSQRAHLEVIFRFLGLRDLDEGEWEKMLGQKKANSQGKYPDMLPETRTLLQEFYAPFNKKLAQLMGDERFTYEDVYSTPEAVAST